MNKDIKNAIRLAAIGGLIDGFLNSGFKDAILCREDMTWLHKRMYGAFPLKSETADGVLFLQIGDMRIFTYN